MNFMIRAFFLLLIINTSLLSARAADYVVTSAAFDGTGTLKNAIETANASNLLRPFVIEFNVSPGSVINVNGFEISRPVIVDATTMPGYVGNPLVGIKGTRWTQMGNGGENGFLFLAGSDGSAVKGLHIGGFKYGIASRASNCVFENNVFNRNLHGIHIRSGAKNVDIRANILGMDGIGADTLFNYDGIIVENSTNVTIGGDMVSKGNLISGNWYKGIYVRGNNVNLRIENNKIGTDITGRYAVGNMDGIFFDNGSSNSSVYVHENLISGNTSNGIFVEKEYGAITLTGNLIGTDITGFKAIPNPKGIYTNTYNGTMNLGQAGSEPNTISGNTWGIFFRYGHLVVENNFIGLSSDGNVVLGNDQYGLFTSSTASCRIGNGEKAGANYICSNGDAGIFVNSSNNTEITRNYVGISYRGDFLGNKYGILLKDSPYTEIKGCYVSDNKVYNIHLTNSDNCKISSNFIGISFNKSSRSSRNIISADGINVFSSDYCQIGGELPSDGNVICGNHNGIFVLVSNVANIKNNRIGIDQDNDDASPNNNGMLVISSQSSGISDNYVGNNRSLGIGFESCGNLTIKGNKVGIDSQNDEVENGEEGLRLISTNMSDISDNIICASGRAGVSLSNSSNNTFYGNRVGTDETGIVNLRNKGNGIELKAGSNNNVIGSIATGKANIIAFNMGNGILVEASEENKLSANLIYANEAEKAINLNLDQDGSLLGNTGKATPVISSVALNSGNLVVEGTSSAIGDTLQFFSSDNDGQEAFEFLNAYTTISDGAMNWSASIPISALPDGYFVVTATDENNNTSEMSEVSGISNCPTAKPVFTYSVACPDKPLYAGKFVDFEVANYETGYYYVWELEEDVSPMVETTEFISYPFQTGGTKSVRVIQRIANCAVASDPVPIEVTEFKINAPHNKLCEGEVVNLSVEPDNLSPSDYTWYRYGIPLDNTGPDLSVRQGGAYKVEISSWNCDEGQGGDAELLMVGLSDEIMDGTASKTILIVERICIVSRPGWISCGDCLGQFQPEPDKDYVISLWVREDVDEFVETYQRAGVKLDFKTRGEDNIPGPDISLEPIYPDPDEPVMDGWQKIQAEFRVPKNTVVTEIRLLRSSEVDIYYDDIRIHPVESNPKTYVYDPATLRLMAILDENNYATFYEYDQEGKLIRVKKETERGIMTIQENFNNIHKRTGIE